MPQLTVNSKSPRNILLKNPLYIFITTVKHIVTIS